MFKYFRFGNKRSKRSEEVKGQQKRNGRKATALSKEKYHGSELHGSEIMKSRTSHASAAAGKCLSLKSRI